MNTKTVARDPTRRARILIAARNRFLDRGFSGTTLSQIALDVGCSKGALYLEFADKESLLKAVLEHAFDGVRKRYEAEVASRTSPLERLVETLAFAFREHAREPLFARMLREDPELKALTLMTDVKAKKHARLEIERLSSWVDEGIAAGEIRADVDRDVVPLLIGVLRHAPLHVPVVTLLGAGPQTILDGLLQLFRRGLAADARASRKGRARS